MSIPSDREIMKVISRPGGVWHDFERNFARKVIAKAQKIAVDEDIASSAFRGRLHRGDEHGKRYFSSFQTKLLANGDIYFYNEARHAEWLELGNEPNGPGGYIYPKKAKVLAFDVGGGQMVFASRVKTIKPRHIMEQAVNQTIREMT